MNKRETSNNEGKKTIISEFAASFLNFIKSVWKKLEVYFETEVDIPKSQNIDTKKAIAR
jgi:hypothetical protein